MNEKVSGTLMLAIIVALMEVSLCFLHGKFDVGLILGGLMVAIIFFMMLGERGEKDKSAEEQ